MTLKEKVELLEKKIAVLYWIVNASVPNMKQIKDMEKHGFNSSLEDSDGV